MCGDRPRGHPEPVAPNVADVVNQLFADPRYAVNCLILLDNGVDAVILACTEIPLVIGPDDLPVPVIDTARCHAEVLFERAVC